MTDPRNLTPDNCIHCRLPIPQADRVIEQTDNGELHFCCPGCRGAYAIITGAGLDSFYAKRTWEDPGTPDGAFETVYNDAYLEAFIVDQGGSREISFIVAGIRCAACIWLIESILSKITGVEQATVNYGTHRGRVRFDSEQTSPSRVFKVVAGLGYVPRPFTQDAARILQEQENRSLLIRFGTAAFLSMQLMGYSIALYGGYLSGMDLETRQLMQYFAALVATPVVFFSGAPFLRGAWRSVCNMAPDMDLLVALGVLTAYLYSLGALVFGGEVYFETSAMIVTLILLGRLLESGARRRAMAGIDRLLNLAPDTARRIGAHGPEVVTSAQLLVGDVIEVGPGDRFPVDGRLVDFVTEIDESVLTGEAAPVLRHPGDLVLSGSMNVSTVVRIRVEKTTAGSFMARITSMVEEAQSRRAPVQGLADRVAGVFVPSVICIALATGLYWYLTGSSPGTAFMYGIAVLVVACPCALGLATPTAILVSTGAAAGAGILFRGGDTLEKAARLTVAAFDKTGTLTDEHPQVVDMEPVAVDRHTLLVLAAKAETGSNHPLARGILSRARQEGISSSNAGGTIVAGKGVRMESADGLLLTGSRSFMAENGVMVPDRPAGVFTEVHVALNGAYKGCVYLDSQIRTAARQTVAEIDNLGIKTVLLTGDHRKAAENVAGQTGIVSVHSDMSPTEKEVWVQKMRRKKEIVLMVGDGVNDAPALSEADVGCAMGGGTDLALETSDLVLVNNSLKQLPLALKLARKTLRIIRQNLFWAFTYNLVAIPLAAAGKLAPVYAAAAMATSSVCVVANSLRLRGLQNSKQIDGETSPGDGGGKKNV